MLLSVCLNMCPFVCIKLCLQLCVCVCVSNLTNCVMQKLNSEAAYTRVLLQSGRIKQIYLFPFYTVLFSFHSLFNKNHLFSKQIK
jgi:hypothetical protein